METIFGKITTPSSSIKQLLEQAEQNIFDPATIYGQAYLVDIGTTRTGKIRFKGEIFDGNDEVKFQAFLNAEKYPDGISLKSGAYVAMQGELIKNQYTGWDWALEVNAVVKVDPPKIEKDPAELPRVELQSFLQMSKMRSATSYDDYFARLSALGHKYGAVTDIHSVQGYPSAYSAAKKNGVQMIFGTTATLASEDNKVVYGEELYMPLLEPVYVSFDVETTGLSAVNDSIIEIGATKIQNGKVLERYQAFVQTDKPISTFTTELTGITQEQVDNGITLEEAIRRFDSFIEDAILIAHNATFDRDFIVESYKKLGLTFPEKTIIDTLEIGRSLEPDSKSNRLNVVAKRYLKRIEASVKELKAELKAPEKLIKDYEKDQKAKKPKNEISEFDYHQAKSLQASLKDKITHLNQRILELTLDKHHRADQDAEVTGHIFTEMIYELQAMGYTSISELNKLLGDDVFKRAFAKEITIIATNEIGKKNLYKILSLSHQKYLHRIPRVTKTMLNEHREGILIGSGSHDGPLFELVVNKPIEQAMEEAKFYDFLEIQPSDIAQHLVAANSISSKEEIETAWKKIYAIGKKLEKPIIATGHVHYLNNTENDTLFHNVLQYHEDSKLSINRRKGRKGVEQVGRHLRNTQEMMDSFPWLSPEAQYEVVVTNSNWVAEQCEAMSPVPDKLYPPKIDGANEELRNLATETAQSLYGNPLPEYVKARLDKELDSIIGHGFGVIYLISQKLVKNSNDNGYLVGSRGSVGSSFVATMTGITEVNPLKPHYVSKTSKWHVFFDHEDIASGYDLPLYFGELLDENKYSESCRKHVIEKIAESLHMSEEQAIEVMKNHIPDTCPLTGQEGLIRDGQDIPFETFLGFKGDKVPDIDLNFSGEYQTTSHKYVEELFGEKYVFRAGTIGTVADKKAYGYVASYGEENEHNWSPLRINRLKMGIEGAKNTSGQHPGGILVVPDYMEPEDFTPVQYPAEDSSKGVRTSHFDFHSIHDNILKLDILGHDDPTIIRMLQDLTGIDPKTVAPNNEMALKLFTAPEEALGISMNDIVAETGTLGVPEFGTEFVQQMILDTKPTTFAELVKISGLSHGTDVWLGNAKDLIDQGVCTLKSVIDTRDNIMVYLMQKRLDPSLSFTIMESVRKGKGLTADMESAMIEYEVPVWYLESCKKIKYMFPKAHAAAYVLSAMRIANFKVFHPKEFYAAVLSVRYNDENIRELNLEPKELKAKIKEYDAEIKVLNNKEPNKANRMKRTMGAMKLVLEAKVRGVEFGPVSIENSHASKYIIKDGVLIPPFVGIEGLGLNAAELIHEEFQKEPFKSTEDMKVRGIKPSVMDKLRDFNCLEKIEDVQYYLF
ncbi:exonuclease domain-containing protein [Bacillus cereus group sp. TH152-1LC]|nr:exonuclease domain-containing protein [Bacillus cereus group sp. TH152-1LC]MDA1674638.1 exonuclease domain-containing protein [Bacillus cereus group sp. TH152-1LC]